MADPASDRGGRPAPAWSVKAPHLIPAIAAIALVGCILVAGESYARRVEARSLRTLAEPFSPIKWQGEALQRAAFEQPDLLPVYGGSELLVPNPMHASAIFRSYPTGFNIFPVGNAATTCLIMLERLAAVGPELRGKKVAITLTPGLFFLRQMVGADAYAGNFSRLHAAELIFNTDLSLDLRQRAAARMLDYPGTLEDEPLLRQAVERLADGSLSSRVAYAALWPLGRLQIAVLRLQDHWETLSFIRNPTGLKPPSRSPLETPELHWDEILAEGERVARATAGNNPYGFRDTTWEADLKEADSKERHVRTDRVFRAGLDLAREWTDFELLLRGLNELGAQPLVLSMPIKGLYFDRREITASARRAFYARERELAAQYGVPLIDFEEQDGDRLFAIDFASHPSAKGWTIIAQALDTFYHGGNPASAARTGPEAVAQRAPQAPSPAPARSEAVAQGSASDAPRESAARKPAASGPRARARYEGTLDRGDCQVLVGWAWDSTRPDTPVEVEIHEGPKLLARVTADRLRPGLRDHGKGDGRHGFSVPTPAALKDGKPHVVHIKVAASDFELVQSPRTITCADAR